MAPTETADSGSGGQHPSREWRSCTTRSVRSVVESKAQKWFKVGKAIPDAPRPLSATCVCLVGPKRMNVAFGSKALPIEISAYAAEGNNEIRR